MLFRCIYTSIVVWFFLQFFFSFLKMGSPPPARVEVQCKCKTRSLPAPSAPPGFTKRPIQPNPTTNYLAQGLAHMQNEYKPAGMSATTQPRPSTPSPRKAEGRNDSHRLRRPRTQAREHGVFGTWQTSEFVYRVGHKRVSDKGIPPIFPHFCREAEAPGVPYVRHSPWHEARGGPAAGPTQHDWSGSVARTGRLATALCLYTDHREPQFYDPQ